MFNWFKVESEEKLEENFRLSHCCGARVTGTPNGNRYLDGVCRQCGKRCIRYDVYKNRFCLLNTPANPSAGKPNSILV